MKLGLFAINANLCATDPLLLGTVAERAEHAGWESVWTGEHYVLPDPPIPESPAPPETPMLDPFVALTVAAVRTSRLLLGTGVTVVPYHREAILAKKIASLDRVSAGRFLFGIGVGYLEPEFAALGVDPKTRARRLREQLDTLELLWNPGDGALDGSTAGLGDVRAEPRPVQRPHPPYHFGGYAHAAYRRAVERGHGWYGYALDLDATGASMASLAEAQRRYPRPHHLPQLEISVTPHPRLPLDPSTVEQFAALGVHRLIALPPAGARRGRRELLEFVDELPARLGADSSIFRESPIAEPGTSSGLHRSE
jgi:probable F420-dependent oxidoreductase